MAVVAWSALAAALRLWHVGHGLPDFTEEAFIFRKAAEFWGVGNGRPSLDPHSFVYPSLTIYLQFLVQQLHYHLGAFHSPADFLLTSATDPTTAVILGRFVSIAADVATVVFVGRVARRFGELPEDITAARLAAYLASRTQHWGEVDRAMQRSARVLARRGPVPIEILLAQAEARFRMGDRQEAAQMLLRIIRAGDPDRARAAGKQFSRLYSQSVDAHSSTTIRAPRLAPPASSRRK